MKTPLYPEVFAGGEPPTRITENTVITPASGLGVLHLGGRGTIPAPVFFVAAGVTQDEVETNTGCPPGILRGSSGKLVLRCLSRTRFADVDWRFSAIVKYLPDGKP